MPVASKTVIGNQALLRLAVQPVLNFDEDSKAAKFLNRIYDDLLGQEQSKGFYGFTIDRAILAPSTTAPLYEFEFYMPFPGDFLQLVTVELPGARVGAQAFNAGALSGRVKRESQGLASNSDTVCIRYVKKITDTTKFPDPFVEVIVSRLALEGARFLRANDRQLQVDMMFAYRSAVASAKFLSSVESTPEDLGGEDWTGSR